MDKQSFGQVIRARRDHLGMSAEKLAAESDCSFSAIYKLEHGRSYPGLAIAHRMLKALGARMVLGDKRGRFVIDFDD